jgi:hypothetical protein
VDETPHFAAPHTTGLTEASALLSVRARFVVVLNCFLPVELTVKQNTACISLWLGSWRDSRNRLGSDFGEVITVYSPTQSHTLSLESISSPFPPLPTECESQGMGESELENFWTMMLDVLSVFEYSPRVGYVVVHVLALC